LCCEVNLHTNDLCVDLKVNFTFRLDTSIREI